MPLNVNYIIVQDCSKMLLNVFHSLTEEEQEELADSLEKICDKYADKIDESEEEEEQE
jgi:ribosome recycling factor